MQTDVRMQFQEDYFWNWIVTTSPSCDFGKLRHIWPPGRIRSISRPKMLKYRCPVIAYLLVCSGKLWAFSRYLEGESL